MALRFRAAKDDVSRKAPERDMDHADHLAPITVHPQTL